MTLYDVLHRLVDAVFGSIHPDQLAELHDTVDTAEADAIPAPAPDADPAGGEH